jgi:hypothetical protein
MSRILPVSTAIKANEERFGSFHSHFLFKKILLLGTSRLFTRPISIFKVKPSKNSRDNSPEWSSQIQKCEGKTFNFELPNNSPEFRFLLMFFDIFKIIKPVNHMFYRLYIFDTLHRRDDWTK